MKPASLLALLLLLCAVMALPAQAQTVINPRTVEFDPSADHNAVTSGGQQVVQRYDLQIYPVSGTTPYTTGNLGKPAPQSDGKIRVDFSTLVTPWPLPDGTYDARVVAVGPTGTAPSDVSNTFAFQSQSCTYTLGSAQQSFPSGGAAGSVTVTAGTGCPWTAVSDSAWLIVSASTTSGTGSGVVNFTVTTNVGATARSATLTVGGKTVVITQAAPVACSYSLSTNALSFTDAGGGASVTVSTTGTCTWTSTGAPTWLHFSTSSGTGSGAATFSVDRNTGTATRTASLTIAGQGVSVTQTAPTPCSYSISPTGQSFPSDGGSVSVAVTAASGCSWTASSSDSWASLGSSGGTGNGSVTVRVTANGTTAARSTTLTIAGQPFAVTESGLVCSYSLSSSSQPFGEGGGTGSFMLSSPGACAWTATSSAPWLTITNGGSGSGGGTITFLVAQNTTTSPRTATITAGGQVFTVSQAAAAVVCSYALSSPGQNVSSAAGGGTVGVTTGTGCAWTATSGAPQWLTVTPPSGSGTATVAFSVLANSATTSRTAALTVAGQIFTVTQDALSCSFSLTPASESFGAGAGNGSVTVSGPNGCGWTATNSASWVTLGATAGNGGAAVPIAVAANPNATARSASLTIAGKAFTVTQAAGSCSYTLSPTASQKFGPGGGSGTVSVSCGSGCAWTATVSSSPVAVTWVTLTTKSGSGAGTITYTVAKNTTSTERTATIVLDSGQTYTVTQAAANGLSKPKKPRITSVVGG